MIEGWAGITTSKDERNTSDTFEMGRSNRVAGFLIGTCSLDFGITYIFHDVCDLERLFYIGHHFREPSHKRTNTSIDNSKPYNIKLFL